MKEVIRKLRIGTYKAQLAMWEEIGATLSIELEKVDLKEDQILAIGDRLDHATRENIALQYALQFALDRLGQKKKEG